MSKENRENEYNRLMELDREKDIPQKLKDEFGKKPISPPKPQVPSPTPKASTSSKGGKK